MSEVRAGRCEQCGGEVQWLPCYDGRRRAFAPGEVRSAAAGDDVRWFLTSNRGAVPGTQLAYQPTMPFRVRHVCRSRPAGEGEDVIDKAKILRSAPPVREFVVRPPYRFGYRWESEWGHIVHPDRGLCGAKVIGEMTPREAARLPSMPMCPECLVRYRRRHPHDAVRRPAEPA
ncbi:hypothetical protein [Oerskovia turbata]